MVGWGMGEVKYNDRKLSVYEKYYFIIGDVYS